MKKTQLSSSEIQDLINRYNSELKKLEFQVDEVNLTLSELENLLADVEGREQTAIEKVQSKTSKIAISDERGGSGRGRSAMVAESDVTRPEKSNTVKKGYKLSFWDEYVIKSILKSNRAIITQEIIESVQEQAAQAGVRTNLDEVKKRVIRSLQKLVNRRGDLVKVAFKGKGYAYAMPEWLTPRGKLDKNYA